MIRAMSSIDSYTDDGYANFSQIIQDGIAALTGPLLQTNAEGLFELYLDGLTPARRQHYTCHACRRFIDTYGGLVAVDPESGKTRSAVWAHDVPIFFRTSVEAMSERVSRAKVVDVFVNDKGTWGIPQTGEWFHLSGQSSLPIYNSRLKTPSQIVAEKHEDFGVLSHALRDYSKAAVEQAVRVLQAEALFRSEKALGIAEWFLRLHQAVQDRKGPTRDNLVWLAVATAPPGFCHIRSTMISTLLDDIVASLPFEEIKRRWALKMHPLQYQRPATLTDGNIARAEKVIAELQSAGALARRFARLTDIVPLWLPTPATVEPQVGVFGHLRKSTDAVKKLDLPALKMTWTKFARTILPTVLSMEFYVTSASRQGFYGLTTAVDPDAPPLLQWDGIEGQPRNPVAWYHYSRGSHASDWSLESNEWCAVNAICLKPPMWHNPDKFVHYGNGVYFVLEGAEDQLYTRGINLFPETLRSEYHEIRATMEAFSQKAQLVGIAEGDANGISLYAGREYNHQFRVVTNEGSAIYMIDRWE